MFFHFLSNIINYSSASGYISLYFFLYEEVREANGTTRREGAQKEKTMSNSRLTTVRNRLALFSRTVHEQFPLIAAFVGLSFVALARVGECVTGTRRRRVSLASSAAMLMMVGPAAAQVGCDNGALSFLSDLYALVSQSAGLILSLIHI